MNVFTVFVLIILVRTSLYRKRLSEEKYFLFIENFLPDVDKPIPTGLPQPLSIDDLSLIRGFFTTVLK